MCLRDKVFHREKIFYWGKFLMEKSDKISNIICHFSPMRYLMFDFPPRFTNIDHKLLLLSFLWLQAVNPFSNFRKHSEKVPYLLQHQIVTIFTAYDFYEIELNNGCFSSEFYKSGWSTILHNTLERLLLC